MCRVMVLPSSVLSSVIVAVLSSYPPPPPPPLCSYTLCKAYQKSVCNVSGGGFMQRIFVEAMRRE